MESEPKAKFFASAESHGRKTQYLKFLQAIIKSEGKDHNRRCQDMVMAELVNTQAGEEVSLRTLSIFGHSCKCLHWIF